eukprot:18332-Heterococcus_DN1.PRE.2
MAINKLSDAQQLLRGTLRHWRAIYCVITDASVQIAYTLQYNTCARLLRVHTAAVVVLLLCSVTRSLDTAMHQQHCKQQQKQQSQLSSLLYNHVQTNARTIVSAVSTFC